MERRINCDNIPEIVSDEMDYLIEAEDYKVGFSKPEVLLENVIAYYRNNEGIDVTDEDIKEIRNCIFSEIAQRTTSESGEDIKRVLILDSKISEIEEVDFWIEPFCDMIGIDSAFYATYLETRFSNYKAWLNSTGKFLFIQDKKSVIETVIANKFSLANISDDIDVKAIVENDILLCNFLGSVDGTGQYTTIDYKGIAYRVYKVYS